MIFFFKQDRELQCSPRREGFSQEPHLCWEWQQQIYLFNVPLAYQKDEAENRNEPTILFSHWFTQAKPYFLKLVSL